MPQTVHYIGPYQDSTQKHRNLLVQISGVSKMDYIISSLQKAGFYIKVYSTAPTKNTFFCHFPRFRFQPDQSSEINYIDTFGGPTIVFKALARLWSLLQLFYYLLGIRSDEIILVYHVYQYRYVVNFIAFFKKKKLFFEVEEIYNVLWRASSKKQLSEIKYLKKADGYIFVNDLIGAQCKLDNKPHVICYGDYRVKSMGNKIDDGKIHLVFSGLIGNKESAIQYSLEVIKLLPANYILHITGYGMDVSLRSLQDSISLINYDLNREAIIYHGCLDDLSYKELLSTFHIGLATSELNSNESMYMFPSKVMAYLGLNLVVVATPLICLMDSRVSKIVNFSENNSPLSIATTIQSINSVAINNIQTLNYLNESFISDLKALLVNI
jgi:hypothetical protein